MSPRQLGRTLRALRDDRGLTQRDLAKRATVTPGYIAQLEQAVRKNPSLTILKRLAKALGVPVTDLLE